MNFKKIQIPVFSILQYVYFRFVLKVIPGAGRKYYKNKANKQAVVYGTLNVVFPFQK